MYLQQLCKQLYWSLQCTVGDYSRRSVYALKAKVPFLNFAIQATAKT